MWFPFEIRDSELLELDCLVADQALQQLLLPLDGCSLVLQDQQARTVKGVYNTSDGCLTGKGLGRFFQRLGSSRLLVT